MCTYLHTSKYIQDLKDYKDVLQMNELYIKCLLFASLINHESGNIITYLYLYDLGNGDTKRFIHAL